MTLKDAKALRDYIRECGYHSIVPLGFGPDRYFATTHGSKHRTEWHSSAAFRKFHASRLRERRRIMREYEAMAFRRLNPPRSPIELMIDKACGLA